MKFIELIDKTILSVHSIKTVGPVEFTQNIVEFSLYTTNNIIYAQRFYKNHYKSLSIDELKAKVEKIRHDLIFVINDNEYAYKVNNSLINLKKDNE